MMLRIGGMFSDKESEHESEMNILKGWMAVLCLSICASGFIAIQCGRQYTAKGSETSTVVRFLGLKGLSDCIFALNQLAFVSFLYSTNGKDALPPAACVFSGFITQFFVVAEQSFNFCIALDVFMLLMNPWTYDTKLWRNRMLAGVLFLCCTTFGILGANKLGDSGDNDCWIKNPMGGYSWFQYGPGFFYWAFCIIATLFLTYKVGKVNSIKTQSSGGDDQFFRSDLAWRMLKKMVLFTSLYIISWTPILYRHIVELGGTPPDQVNANLQYTATFFAFSLGTWDLVVWYGSNSISFPCLTWCFNAMSWGAFARNDSAAEGRGDGDGDDPRDSQSLDALHERVRASFGDAMERSHTTQNSTNWKPNVELRQSSYDYEVKDIV